MSRVVRPGSSSVPQKPTQASQAQKPKPLRPGQKTEKPRVMKPGGTAGEDVEEANRAENTAESHSPDAREAHEAAHAQGWSADNKQADEKKEAREEVREAEERKEQSEHPRPFVTGNKGAQTGGHFTAKQAPAKKDGFEGQSVRAGSQAGTDTKPGAVQAKVVTGVQAAAQIGNEAALKHPKQPDAFTLLHQAKDKGVYFKEDEAGAAMAESTEDPELAAAVEEAIRLLFGVKGVMRVGAGRNEADEPVVVVVANQGFGEGSLSVVPEKVHRFPTLLALPYDLLPLKKER